jgi:cobyrinic acid a,c-diamide synthase
MIPRIVIAGTQSGAGKTTVSSGLMKALTDQHLRVQGFKVGPDYIDPQCHRWATGRPSRNLDTWLMTPDQVVSGFLRGAAGADVAIIEGVMGMFDGAGGTGEAGSTAHLAKLLRAPVVLVLDAHASARSAAAVALGFKMLDHEVHLAGVICNRVGSDRHAEMLREALDSIGIPMLGALRHNGELRVPENRLGLALPGGDGSLPEWIRLAGEAVASQMNLDLLLDLARGAGELPAFKADSSDPFAPRMAGRYSGLRVAVGLDPAFWFYYEDTFDLMRHWGVEPIFFNPIRDGALPPDIDGLYLGGGFPERHAAALSANGAMRGAVRSAWDAGLPMLAECGGYLYLLEGLTGEDSTVYQMAGCISGVARLQPRLQGMGYRVAEPGGVKGHLFHYTRVEGSEGQPAWQLSRSNGEFERSDGYRQASVVASYLHVHHATQPWVMDDFLSTCQRYQGGRA